MNLRVKIYLFFVLTSCLLNVYAQNIENIDFYSEGKNIIVTYELKNCSPDERYDITLSFVDQKSNQRVVPKTITGDLKNQECGLGKRIVWEISKDVSTLSGKFYPELNFKLAPNSPLTDADGYVYKTVKIGNQIWFAENLRTSKYNDGTPIPNVISGKKWSSLTTGAYVGAYDYKTMNYDTNYINYGKLYNWYAVSPTTNGNKNVCPTGWHVPTDAEWTVLTDYLGGLSVSGSKMKDVGTTSWISPNIAATNLSGFTGLPGGCRYPNGEYYYFGSYGNWWSSSEKDADDAWARSLYYYRENTDRDFTSKKCGFSVRCLRD